jgi:hypothetical protein
MPRVVVDLQDGRGLLPAREALSDGPNDLPYFVRLAEVAADLTDDFDRFVISYSPTVAQQLTARDVWLFVGDESVPPVANGHCRVLRTYGDRFTAPRRDLAKDPLLALIEQVQLARNVMRGVWRNRGRPRDSANGAGWLPLGTPAFAGVPDEVPPITERRIDVGFRGSIGGGLPFAPKTISRRRMEAALARLPADLVIDFVEFESFLAAYAQDPSEYVRSLLDTKICLAPRGGSTETFRVFEGALAGCAVITEPLPPAWFYAGLPRVELRSWSELPAAIEDLRSHASLLESMSRGARDWALNVVSPEAVGRWAAGWLTAPSK